MKTATREQFNALVIALEGAHAKDHAPVTDLRDGVDEIATQALFMESMLNDAEAHPDLVHLENLAQLVGAALRTADVILANMTEDELRRHTLETINAEF